MLGIVKCIFKLWPVTVLELKRALYPHVHVFSIAWYQTQNYRILNQRLSAMYVSGGDRATVNTLRFFISITDFAWASQCLIFQPFEPQKMLIQCLEFAPSNNTFELIIGKSVRFWQYGSFVENIWIHKILKMPNFSQILYPKRAVWCQSLTWSASANA